MGKQPQEKIDFNAFFSGERLYGDDFCLEEILEWFNDEKNSYLVFKNGKPFNYKYHGLNIFHGYRFLKNKDFENVLGIGSAFGYEFMPILHKIKKLTILESAEGFFGDKVGDLPVRYLKSNPNGILPFEDNSFDLITCFGVLHHISNVSFVISQLYRCLKKGGYLLIREPTISQGDWRLERKGVTARERGIPIHIFDHFLKTSGFKIIQRRRCCFPLVGYINSLSGPAIYNSGIAVFLDYLFCKLFYFNNTYHARYAWQKLRPKMVSYLAMK